MKTMSFAVRLSLLFILALSSFMLCPGCAALGVAAWKLHGPPKVPAKYVPAKTPMLVLVENYQHQTAAGADADVLAQHLSAEMEVHDVAPQVPLEKLQELRDAHPAEYPTMAINHIAQAVGASQVMYVQLRTANVTPVAGGDGYIGEAMATVKVVDAAGGETLWPVDMSEGYSVSARTKLQSQHGAGTAADVRHQLATQLTDQISRLFYKWQPEDMSPEGYTE